MENIETKYLDNSFILVGHSGYGKSSTCKALTGNENIEISSNHKSCTSKVSYYPGNYKYLMKNTYFTMIDTPGLDDSEGRDKQFYQDLRNMLTTKDLKVKGIFIVFSLQTSRFGHSEKTIIEKIINLVPIKDLWKYITILVTHCYYKPEKLKKKKDEFIKDIKELFEGNYFPNSFLKYGIMGNFNDLNLAFVDFDDENPTIEEAKELQEIIEKSLKKEPLFQQCKIEVQDNVPLIQYNDITKKTGILYKCSIKNIKYYGQNGKILNEIRIILDKKKEKDLKKSDLQSKDAFISSYITWGIGLVALGGLAFPPLEIVAAVGYFGGMTASLISSAVGWTKIGINAYVNSDFKNKEINDFLDETNN